VKSGSLANHTAKTSGYDVGHFEKQVGEHSLLSEHLIRISLNLGFRFLHVSSIDCILDNNFSSCIQQRKRMILIPKCNED